MFVERSYPDGENVAISASAVPDHPGQLYVNCYDNDEDRTCLASFTPYGKVSETSDRW